MRHLAPQVLIVFLAIFGLNQLAAGDYATIKTSAGTIVIELDNAKAPISVANFEQYAKEGFYDGTLFHRVMPGFMVQGGGFDHHGAYPQTMHKKPGARAGIKNEWQNGLKNGRGTLAMARLGNEPDSGTNQFFINLAANDFLDQPRDGAGYAVFAKVIAGMDVVDRIGETPTTRLPNGMADVPQKAVMIESVTILSKDAAMGALVSEAEAKVKTLEAELAAAKKAVEALKKGGGE
jgi:peptidyl-prolyl cis-trans isomerase A (cyclophilin A)